MLGSQLLGASAMDRRGFLRFGGLGLGAGALLTACGGGGGSPVSDPPPDPPSGALPPPDPALSVLKRTSFGVHEDALAQIESLGVSEYLERQLDYESINASRVETAVALRFTTVSLPALITRPGFPDNAQRLVTDLLGATLFRMFFSPRQLYEVMVEFWSNHFAIYLLNGLEPVLKPPDDASVIRPHALGSFRELLSATARSPAMLFSLDNYLNTRDAPNENYARELMELHTLGVDGGYTEADIKEVARCFTGWSINFATGAFSYVEDAHDSGAKTVLGRTIPAGGQIEDGEAVLDLLLTQPATGRFLATKLCRRFIGEAPAAVVEDVARTYAETAGDIRAMLRTLFASPAFLDARDTKFDRPLEFLGQIVRTLDPQLRFPSDNAQAYIVLASLLGQLPFYWQAPDGYPDVTSYWASTSGLLNRWRIALYAVTAGGFDLAPLAGEANTVASLIDQLAATVLRRSLLEPDRAALIDWLSAELSLSADSELPAAVVEALLPAAIAQLLSSAYFQLR